MNLMNLQKFFADFSNIPKPVNPYSGKKQFSTMDYIIIGENKITIIISKLLDPNGPHNCGATFLNLFLKKFAPEFNFTEDPLKIKTEDSIPQSHRRIDLSLSHGEKWVLAVENKPWASDQGNQIADYIEYLNATKSNQRKLIYISAQGTPPSERSISYDRREKEFEKGSLKYYSYYDLRVWLDDCQKECEDKFLRHFIINFSVYLRDSVNGRLLPVEQNPEQVNFIASRLDEAQKIAALVEGAKLHIIETALQELSQNQPAPQKPWVLERDNWPWFYRPSSFDERLLISFQFLENNFENLHFGVSYRWSQINDLKKRYSKWPGNAAILNTVLSVQGKATVEWMWLAPIPIDDTLPNNWANEIDIWKNPTPNFSRVAALADQIDAEISKMLGLNT